MAASPDYQSLLADNRLQWQPVDEHLERGKRGADEREKIERLALASQYALKQLARDPGIIDALLGLERFELDAGLKSCCDGDSVDLERVKRELRLYRHRKLTEIIYLDVVSGEPLTATLHHLSDLADQLIETALYACERQLSAKHGQPRDADGEAMRLDIIAMGKLGGRELNFSSDIDLICSYDSDGELDGYGRLSHQEYFSRLVRLLTGVLADASEHGFVYRVDLRLRPWGDSGPVVLSHAALEHYYQLHGREWEQYAMVKARVISGRQQSRDYLAALLKPFVYRRYHDYRVFDGLATLKGKIDRQARARRMRDNIKLGPGGIREIEFFVQAFQILKGGRNRALQSTEIMRCFEALQEQEIVAADIVEQLRDAYCFLRRLENRIQMFDDRQTHDLPQQPRRQARIAMTMGFDGWPALLEVLRGHRENVNRHFTELFKRETEARPEPIIDDGFAEAIDDDKRWEFIERSGVADAEEINLALNRFLRSKSWKFMSARARQRFSRLLPELVATLAGGRAPGLVFERFLKLFASIAGRSVYFELLFQNSALLEKLASLFDKSAWIAEEVASYPMLLENLLHAGDAERFDKASLRRRLALQLANVEGDTELELDSLRLFKREQTLVIAGAELAQEIDAIEVGRYLSELAEIVLDAVYRLASQALRARHGIPQCVDAGERREARFAIIGYGKLGGRELHYRSDLDLIFLHDSDGEQQYTSGEKSIENTVYFARLAQKIISMTSVLTASGKLYEIDSRLRPEGSSGLLVSSLQAYLRYQLEKAWTWEHQALVRARPVAGDPALFDAFAEVRDQVLRQPRDDAQLRRDILEMRERIYRSKRPPETGQLDLKQSRGAMVDVEFLVQYWVLRAANNIRSEALYSDNISLLDELLRSNLITESQSQLVGIYRDYHRLLHESVLQNRSGEVDAEVIAQHTKQVIECWNESFGAQEN